MCKQCYAKVRMKTRSRERHSFAHGTADAQQAAAAALGSNMLGSNMVGRLSLTGRISRAEKRASHRDARGPQVCR